MHSPQEAEQQVAELELNSGKPGLPFLTVPPASTSSDPQQAPLSPEALLPESQVSRFVWVTFSYPEVETCQREMSKVLCSPDF